MNKAIKAKWIKALRSGKYRQTTDVLFDGNHGYCCLGVLRTVMHKGSRKQDDEMLCDEHQDKAGLTVNQQNKLAGMNDKGKTFEQIASYIEKNL